MSSRGVVNLSTEVGTTTCFVDTPSHIVMNVDNEEKKIIALGKVIKMEMVGQDLNQKGLADKVGIHRETLSRYLNATAGYNMPIGILFKIADALDTTVQDLVSKAESR